MVSDEVLGFGELFQPIWGISAEGTVLLMAIFFTLVATIFVIWSLKHRNIEVGKEFGFFIFFGILTILAILGIVSWLIIIFPLFLVGTFIISRRVKGD